MHQQRKRGNHLKANVDEDFHGEYHIWGNSETVLICDDKVIVSPGGKETSVVALNKMTGDNVWQTKSLGGPRAYASATIYEWMASVIFWRLSVLILWQLFPKPAR